MKNQKFEKLVITPEFIEKYSISDDYTELTKEILYYRDHQLEIRGLVIKILIGVMAVSGALSFYNIGASNFALGILSSSLPLLGLFVLSVCLFIDLIYKEGLKLSFVSEARRYEKKYPWITPYHECIISETEIHSVRGSEQILFYFGSAGLLMLISAFSLFIHFQNWKIRLPVLFAYCLFYFGYKWVIYKFLENPTEVLNNLDIEDEKL